MRWLPARSPVCGFPSPRITERGKRSGVVRCVGHTPTQRGLTAIQRPTYHGIDDGIAAATFGAGCIDHYNDR